MSRAERVEVELAAADGTPGERIALTPRGGGAFALDLPPERAGEGCLYRFVLDGRPLPDPFARELPLGVHGPARLHARKVAPALAAARRPADHRVVLYELHVGTFTAEGTYAAAETRLAELAELGVTSVELLPVTAFAGARGWGYDGVALYAPHAAYGPPDALRHFVAAAHAHGLEVVLDVVYNHLGPRGAYLGAFLPDLFTRDVATPWGEAPDFRTAPMRELALDNARHWLVEYGFDGLRLDATHTYVDDDDAPVTRALTDLAASLDPPRRLWFEDARNDPRQVTERGAAGIWADDFHHQMHVLLTGEHDGYYAAHEPTLDALARVIRDGFTYTGQPYAPWDGTPRGAPATALPPHALVYALQNHDQVGNRPDGARLATLLDARARDAAQAEADDVLRAAVTLLLFLPTTPLLFQGEEWASRVPFPFFCDHEPDLADAIREGRKKEFASFEGFSRGDDPPDPQAEATFASARLDWEARAGDAPARMRAHVRELLRLRREDPVLSAVARFDTLDARTEGDVLHVVRRHGDAARHLVVRFAAAAPSPLPVPADAAVLVATTPLAASVRAGAVVYATGPDDARN